MSGRISRHQLFMGIARLASQRSTCMRLNVGAVIVHDKRPVSLGYNGAQAGAAHCPGDTCPGIVPGGCPTTHAEVNALAHVPSALWLNNDILELYCTDSPCEPCAKAIISAQKVRAVYFERPYRNPAPLKLLWEYGIQCFEVTPAGYVVDYFTRKVIDTPQ